MMHWLWPEGMMGGAWWPFMWWMTAYWLISLIFIVWALIRIAASDKDAGYKVIWAAIVVFLGLLGVLIYYIVEMSSKTDGSDKGGRTAKTSRHGTDTSKR